MYKNEMPPVKLNRIVFLYSIIANKEQFTPIFERILILVHVQNT